MRERRHLWQRQRNLVAPLTLGQPVRLIGDVIGRAAQEARGEREVGENVIVGHPASAGRATGPVRIVHGPQDFGGFRDGDVLVAKATAPAWTPLFARAAAVITDSGTLAAHASLVAREYGIPAVVATGDATTRLHPGQMVTVDGTAGTITPHTQPIAISDEGLPSNIARMMAMGPATVKALPPRAAASDFKITMHGVLFKMTRGTRRALNAQPDAPATCRLAQRGWTPGRCRDRLAAAARA